MRLRSLQTTIPLVLISIQPHRAAAILLHHFASQGKQLGAECNLFGGFNSPERFSKLKSTCAFCLSLRSLEWSGRFYLDTDAFNRKES